MSFLHCWYCLSVVLILIDIPSLLHTNLQRKDSAYTHWRKRRTPIIVINSIEYSIFWTKTHIESPLCRFNPMIFDLFLVSLPLSKWYILRLFHGLITILLTKFGSGLETSSHRMVSIYLGNLLSVKFFFLARQICLTKSVNCTIYPTSMTKPDEPPLSFYLIEIWTF